MSEENPNLITHNIRCPCCGITVRRHIPEWEQRLMKGKKGPYREHPAILRLGDDFGTVYVVDAVTGERLQVEPVI